MKGELFLLRHYLMERCTQEEPEFCGLAALSMTLNALGVDPRRTWKGAWRWFTETMLDCCKSLEDVKRDGITLNQAACLARCNGADVAVHRYGTFDGKAFRRALDQACRSEDQHMVVSYSRKTFLQSGDGHFSPIGGYHPGRDLVLILDVARFKYAPHWVRVDDLMEAMALLDPATGRPRGFLMLSSHYPRESALFAVNPAAVAWPQPIPCLPATCPAPAASTTSASPFTLRTSSPGSAPMPTADAVPTDATATSAARCATSALPASGTTPLCDGGTYDGSSPMGLEPEWAAAMRFLFADAGDLMRRLLAEPSGAAGSAHSTAEDVGPHDDADGDADDGYEDAGVKDGQQGEVAPAAAASGGGSSAVPSLESLVAALVLAAPVESVCALLSQRPRPTAAGEALRGPCCGCCGGSGGSGVEGGAGAGALAPCNGGATGCGGGHGITATTTTTPLTEAAVAAAAAASGDSATGTDDQKGIVSSSSGSDVGSLDSAGPSDSSVGSLGSTSSRCCHGEPLEHHCVPPQVQCLVADELRFTNMYKLVSYCLRRHRGCPHVQPPDLTVFMQPAMAKPPAQAPAVPRITPASTPAAAVATVPAPVPQAVCCGNTPAAGAAPVGASGAAGATPAASATGACDCGDLGLPELATEKLTAFLLLLPADGGWWPAQSWQQELHQQQQRRQQGQGGNADDSGAAGGETAPAAAAAAAASAAAVARVRVCGRPHCRRCRQRAAAAGSRAAALEGLREQWAQLQRMAPLGLFASAPVLKDELAFIQLQVKTALEAAAGDRKVATSYQ